jgi:hypothetical protein
VRARILSRIIQQGREIMSYKPLSVKECLNRALAWKTPTACVPVARLEEVAAYVFQNPPGNRELNANDLVEGWKEIQNGRRPASGALAGQKQIAERAAAGCERCFGRGQAIIFDSSTGRTAARPCSHEPISDEERREMEAGRDDFLKKVREMSGRAAPGAIGTPPRPPVEEGVSFCCSVCGRRAPGVHGWREFDKCGAALAQKESGEPVLCDGMMLKTEKINDER